MKNILVVLTIPLFILGGVAYVVHNRLVHGYLAMRELMED